jgi:hypothetical protein
MAATTTTTTTQPAIPTSRPPPRTSQSCPTTPLTTVPSGRPVPAPRSTGVARSGPDLTSDSDSDNGDSDDDDGAATTAPAPVVDEKEPRDKRFLVAREIYTTEKSYVWMRSVVSVVWVWVYSHLKSFLSVYLWQVHGLRVTMDVFYATLAQVVPRPPLREMFNNSREILTLHTGLLKQLEPVGPLLHFGGFFPL